MISKNNNTHKTARVWIIAEAGINHNGSLEMAKQLVEEAAKAGAAAVKFHTFIADTLVSKQAPKAEYQTQPQPTIGTNLVFVQNIGV